MSSSFADSVRSIGDSLPADSKRNLYVMVGVLIVSCLLLVGLLAGGGYLIYTTLDSSTSSDGTTTVSDSIVPLSTTNPDQLCPVKPSGGDLEKRGEAIYPIPDYIVAHMLGNGTWKEGCPVPIEDLTLLYLPYWSCDSYTTKTGEMIVHRNVSNQVLTIFDQLFVSGFPIYQMNLMSVYGANDSLAMANNNTSGFCCREKTNKPGTYSLHSYGLAIDVNTYINPYVNGDTILPEGGAPYENRSIVIPGTIIGAGGVCYDAFTQQGWSWGGDWTSYKDYQHFQVDQ